MGGTTAKISVIRDGEAAITHHYEVGHVHRFKRGSGYPLQISAIELLEIGAGGGSIAHVNALGLLKVGPNSASADPGPASYGRGGSQPTVTDADLLLGYLNPANFLGGDMPLDIELAQAVDGKLNYTASTSTPSIGDTVYIGLEYEPDWGEKGYYIVQCYYWDPPGANWYMFDIYKNDTLLTDTITEKQVVDDLFYDGGFTNGIGVGYLDQSRKDQVLRPGDVITFRASSITEGYANFVWEVQEEVSFSTPLFSGPPANVVGNLSDGAIGYFTSYPVLFASTVFE